MSRQPKGWRRGLATIAVMSVLTIGAAGCKPPTPHVPSGQTGRDAGKVGGAVTGGGGAVCAGSDDCP